jgi:3-oxoacyl-[acyl-carrier-protein] synthase III
VQDRRIYQNGREVYKFAVHVMGESAVRALEKCGIATEDVSVFVPHQANIRIIEAAAKRLKLPEGRVFVNLEKYGNTSAASIPIALCEARDQGFDSPRRSGGNRWFWWRLVVGQLCFALVLSLLKSSTRL